MANEKFEIAEVSVENSNIMQALATADFELLGTKLTAEYYKSDDGKDYFLLMPTDEPDSRGITIDKMLDDISTLLGIDKSTLDISELTNNLSKLNIKLDEIKVSLRMAYFYMVKGTGIPTATEYAFHMVIDTSSVLPEDFKLFNIYRIGFAVWNTTSPKIISQMNLYKPEDLLK